MYVKRVVLENVRGFENLDFAFDRSDRNGSGSFAGWAVVTGDNASGKTTLLKAIALALVGPDTLRALQPSLKGWIREGCDEAQIAVEVVADDKDVFTRGRRYERPFWSELVLRADEGPEVSVSPGDSRRGKEKGPKHGPWAENPSGWFCCGYGPFRRLYGASPDAQRLMLGPPRVARFATMFREDATLGECELWLKDLQHKKLEARDKERAILEQVTSLLNDDFLRNDMCVERIDSEGVWLRDRSGTTLKLSDMSDGYRSALALLSDILRHLIDVYGPQDLLETRDGRVVVRHPGVVLVDEIDAHLHPEWQRVIGDWFKQRFPYVQFIVTTHSAFVCQAADERLIFHLPPPGDASQQPFQLDEDAFLDVKTKKPDAIYLSPAFGMRHTRSPEAVEKRREYSGLRARERAGALSASDRTKMQRLLPYVDEAESDGA